MVNETDLSVTPLEPIIAHKYIESGYKSLTPQDILYYDFDTNRLLTLTGDKLNLSICSLTSSLTSSNSGYFHTTRQILFARGFESTWSGLTSSIGIIAIRKANFDSEVIPGSFTATSSAVINGGDYYDSGSGQVIQKSSGLAIGNILNDDGMIVATTNLSSIVTSITSIRYRALVKHTSITVFCKCQPNELNFSLNPSVFSTGSIGSYMNSSFSASNNGARFLENLVSSGIDWQPLITSVGLYDDDYNLLAIAKFAKAIRKPTDLPLTISLQLDL